MSILQESLYNSKGSSNKEYHVEVVAKGEGYAVNTRHGPRGRATVLGTKTPEPVELDKARQIFDRLVAEKIAGGYTRDEAGLSPSVQFTEGVAEPQHSGWQPALLEATSAQALDDLLQDSCWVLGEKIDGERRAVQVLDGRRVVGINRRGLYVPVPKTWEQLFGQLPAGTLIDGEQLGQTLHVFDCLQLGDRDLRGKGYAQRWEAIKSALAEVMGREFRRNPRSTLLSAACMIHVFSEPGEKRTLLETVSRRGGEGVVIRHRDSPYQVGRDPQALKFKFVESASCLVSRLNEGRRSVGLVLLDDGGRAIDVGNVTVPANHDVPAVGAVVEVRYMHLFEGGSLYQPVYAGLRGDIAPQECLLSQVSRVRRKVSGEVEDSHASAHLEPVTDRSSWASPRG